MKTEKKDDTPNPSTTTENPQLTDIRGIGDAVANRIIQYFGSEAAALDIINSSDVGKLSAIEGIGPRLASRIVREFHALKTGIRIEDFLKTEDSVKIYNNIITTIRQFGSTQYSKNKLEVYFPYQGSKLEYIKERQSLFQRAINIFNIIEPHKEDLHKELRKISPLQLPRTSPMISRLVCSQNNSLLRELEDTYLGNCLEFQTIDLLEELIDLSLSYDEAIFISDEAFIGEETPNIQIISEAEAKEDLNLYPERIMIYFAENKEIIESLIQVANNLEHIIEEPILSDFIDRKIIKKLLSLFPTLNQVSSTATISKGFDKEFDRLKNAEKSLETVISDIEAELNDKIAERIESSSIELKGERLLSLVKNLEQSNPQEFQSYISETLYEFIEDLLVNAEKEIIVRLSLVDEEEVMVQEQLFPREVIYPISPNQETKEKLERILRVKRVNREWELKRKIAIKLKEYKSVINTAVELFFELDFFIMLGDFSKQYNLIIPEIGKEYLPGFIIENAFNLNLKKSAINSNFVIEPISYRFGKIAKNLGELDSRRIILLSGANSGGKTTLLMTIAHISILANMGFPVPCKSAVLGLYDEFYYFRKSTGASDAGAFESTLNMLSSILEGDTKRLVLADEMESISEPGASARVIAAFLNLLSNNLEAGGMFVSHLASEIMKVASSDKIRVDGIEARGLDKDLNLIVDRTPRYGYLARSTPQLIVERMVHLSKGKKKEIYSAILDCFKKDQDS